MSIALLAAAAVIIICVLINRISNKIGVPVLIAFIGLGMLFGYCIDFHYVLRRIRYQMERS